MSKFFVGKIKHKIRSFLLAFDVIKICSLIIFASLIILPFGMSEIDLSDAENVSMHFYPYKVLISDFSDFGFNFFSVARFVFYLIILNFIVNIISIFKQVIANKILYIITLFSITIYISLFISGFILFANSESWFLVLNFFAYFAFFVSFIFHIILIVHGIIYTKEKDESYIEHEKFLKDEERKEINKLQKVIEKIKLKKQSLEKDSDDFEKFNNLLIKAKKNLREVKKKTHIKTKIIVVFILTIVFILLIFAYTNLNKYKVLLNNNINSTGRNQAEQTASIYIYSDGLHNKISAFLDGIKEANISSQFPFERVDIITTNNKWPIYIEKIHSENDLADFDIFSYTTSAGKVRSIPNDEKKITAQDAFSYIEYFKNESISSEPIYKSDKGICLYVQPIIVNRKAGHRILGFSVVTYLKEIIDQPYFKAKVFVISMSLVFLYLSIIITLFLADFIADPIIFLCGNIRKTANVLSDMLSGNAKIEADRLSFNGNVKTHDEVKNLSVEIKNIVSLVRGILPYVSFHTLQNAERKMNNRSYKRDLCFLFTDIRGFTTLCEDKEPKDVISILNYYLDLETKIIFENGGDVDKFVGDEMMAFFSGPKKEINACRAAMQIRKAMRIEQKKAGMSGNKLISIGIGINSGPVVFGPVGSKTRKDFTAIGDVVNLAARLEGANKAYGSKTIISETVYEALNENFVCRELDFVAVKGKNEAVRIFEVLQEKEKASNEKIFEIKKLFETGLAYYRKQKWISAEKYFTKCAITYNDNPSKVFLKRIAHYKKNPPTVRWDGVFVMSTK